MLFLPHGIMGLVAARRPRVRLPDESEAQKPVRPPRRAPDKPLLVCEDVRLSFQGVKALAGVSLDVRQGEILGLVGPNGSGKSTLINVISGYYRRHGGRILLDNSDIANLPAHRIARAGIGRTYQIPRPFRRLSVLENVALYATFGAAGLDRVAAEKAALHWLDFVGLGDRAAGLPLELNLHQRKFLELARALASGARLILLDEILAGLTPAEIDSAIDADPPHPQIRRHDRLRRAQHARGAGARRPHRRAQLRRGDRLRPAARRDGRPRRGRSLSGARPCLAPWASMSATAMHPCCGT